jgi:hypothetical protein
VSDDRSSPRRALLVTAGCGARGKARGFLSHPGITGERKTGRVNDTELSLTSRDCGSSPVGSGRRGAGAGRWKAADAGQDKPFWPGGHHRPRDKESTHPGRVSCARNTETLAGVQDSTMLVLVGRPQGKRRSPAGQDGPGSERRQPKGSRKPGVTVADLQRFPHNWPDTGCDARPARELTWTR